MKTGLNLAELAGEIQRQAETKEDYLVTAKSIRMDRATGRLVVPIDDGEEKGFPLTEIGATQLAEFLDIPKRYFTKIAGSPHLLAENVNYWLQKSNGSKRLVRTLDSKARAFLSDRYRILDNEELASNVLPILSDYGVEIESCQITDSNLYIKATYPKLEGEVKVGDIVRAGVTIANSEIGQGALRVMPMIFVLACTNGATMQDQGMSQFHIGRQISDETFRVMSEETKKSLNHAIWSAAKDMVTHALDEVNFRKNLEWIRESANQKISVPIETAVTLLQKQGCVSETERGSILEYLIRGGDFSRWGMSNAVTRYSQDVDSYDRATELETLGGSILDRNKTWSFME